MLRLSLATLLAMLAALVGAAGRFESLCAGPEPAPSERASKQVQAKAKAAAPKQVAKDAQAPSWIWLGARATPGQTVFFRKEVALKGITAARLHVACDDEMTIFIDDQEVLAHRGWSTPAFKDVTQAFTRGKIRAGGRHVLAVRARNRRGASAGLLIRLVFDSAARGSFDVVSDATWRVSGKEAKGWTEAKFNDPSWMAATVVGKLGDRPWDRLTEATLAAASKLREPTATPVAQLKVAKDFKVELLHTVPKDAEGSWVNLCVDPNGRLIVCDQYGGLFRVTPPPRYGKPEESKIEKINVAIGEAQGLLWAFDSLYVVVNRGQKYESGLYRVRDSNGDDQLDEVKQLRRINGGGEHGPHAVVLAPNGKELYIVCGNATKMMELSGSRVPRLWGEDHLLPRIPDGRGFMRGMLGPGGCVYRVDPEGKEWELVSTGYRNPYDIAFNRNGDLFTYDADMEWDINTPWYRPTRVCLAASGSEYGWRNGAGKWPAYYPDSLPSVVDIGPGSPTGIAFAYGAKFPAKYQEALLICDWSYGKLYAVYLTPQGSAYKGQFEEFVTGSPLPLTDVVVNPRDGAVYFTIGGRRTQSGLYRVTYAGKESTAPASEDKRGATLRSLRRRLEAFHGEQSPKAVDTAWPYLGHPDRFIRFAARVAIEHQDPSTWQDRALAEKDPQAALTALLALVRVRAADPHHRASNAPPVDEALKARLLDALDRLDWKRLADAQRLDLLRVYGILFNRMGAPDDATRKRTSARLDVHYPADNRFVNGELCQLLVYLEAPEVVGKTLPLLATAPTQEEQMEYARALRTLKKGWTPQQREQYFAWFHKAAGYRGGASFGGFIKNIKDDAVATLTETEKAELKAILEPRLDTPSPAVAVPPRPLVKNWKMDDLVPLTEKGMKGRDFERGRVLFGAASCFACHRYDNEGGAQGPDLTEAAGRFSVRDLLESIVDPNKVISDQYAAVVITTQDDRVITGRIVNLAGDSMSVMTNMLDPNDLTSVDRKRVESMEPSKVSMMPAGLLDTLKEDEILDLMAYLLSRGDRSHAMFRR